MLPAELDEAVSHRAEVHQASGMVAAQLDITVGQALVRLRAHAFGNGRNLTDVAHDVVGRRLRFDARSGEIVAYAPIEDPNSVYSDNGGLTMLRATLKSLRSRKLRLVLSGMAVVLGVMFVSGAFVLTSTLAASFDSLSASVYSGTDVAVSGKAPVLGGEPDENSATVPAELVGNVRAIPGVEKATGIVSVSGARVIGSESGSWPISFSAQYAFTVAEMWPPPA